MTEQDQQTRAPARRPRRTDERRIWLVTFLLLGSLGSLWALASPVYSGPDEPAHTIRAYSVAHGELLGEEPTDGRTLGLVVRAPALLRTTQPACYAFQPEVTAECAAIDGDTTVREVGTLAGRHPPLYYGIVGLPSWVTVSGKGIYLMRAVSVVLSAAVLASAMVTARRAPWRAMVPAGVLVGLTPMALYLTGLVNPNGFEIAAAVGVWVNGLAAVGEDELDTAVVRRLVAAAVLLAVVRHLGPLWLALIVGTVLLLAGWRRVRALFADRRLQAGAAITVAAVAVQGVWLVVARTLDDSVTGAEPVVAGTDDIVRYEVGQAWDWFREAVGLFGWLDAAAPTLTYVVWVVIGMATVLAALHLGRRRSVLVLLGLLALVLVLPPVLEYPSVPEANFFWQGRYGLPLLVGLPIVASWVVARSGRATELVGSPAVWFAGVALWVAHVLAFGQALRRYTVGANGTPWFWTRAHWDPPVPSLLLLVGYAAVVGGWVWWCRPRQVGDVDEAAVDPAAPAVDAAPTAPAAP